MDHVGGLFHRKLKGDRLEHYTFDSFECATQSLAPTSAACRCRLIGEDVQNYSRHSPVAEDLGFHSSIPHCEAMTDTPGEMSSRTGAVVTARP
jgi:hypothetical protein